MHGVCYFLVLVVNSTQFYYLHALTQVCTLGLVKSAIEMLGLKIDHLSCTITHPHFYS